MINRVNSRNSIHAGGTSSAAGGLVIIVHVHDIVAAASVTVPCTCHRDVCALAHAFVRLCAFSLERFEYVDMFFVVVFMLLLLLKLVYISDTYLMNTI